MIKISISEFFPLNVSRKFFNCIMYTEFGFMLSNLLHANLCLFVFGATLLH